jgi:F420-0:gamma-glutamyl ligase
MVITTIKTPKVTSKSHTLPGLLDEALTAFEEKSIVAISSKIVSLCEGRVVPIDSTDKDDLIAQESDYYLPAEHSLHGHHFSIVRNTIVGSAGIDVSNGDDHYILWPHDPQKTANEVRKYLQERFLLQEVGVLIVDSISTPLRLGALGTAIGFSGFEAIRDYAGKEDLFGRPMKVEKADVIGGLAASAALAMGEGAEQTPLAVISDAQFIAFQDQDPSEEDLATLRLTFEDDLFGPFFKTAPWRKGKRTT